MTKLNSDIVAHVAKLAKLTLTGKEIEKFGGQLSKVVAHISKLNEVDTSDTDPTSQTGGLADVSAKDEIHGDMLPQADALSGSKKTINGYFTVAAIFQAKDV